MKNFLIGLVCACMYLTIAIGSAQAETITVMLPPWGEISQEGLAKFEAETGIDVELTVLGWDQIHDKIAIASVANTAAADVVDFDWSWAGEFSQTEWFTPLNEFVSDDMEADIPLIGTFTAKGDILAIPWMNDFRVSAYNTEVFARAGISAPPTTWDEVIEDCKQIKAKTDMAYPLGFALSATEGTVTNFILMTLSMAGDLFNADSTLNQQNAHITFQFIHDALYVHEIIDPAMATMNDQEVVQAFFNGSFAILPPAHPAVLEDLNDPEQSQIVGKGALMLVPGRADQRSATFGLPEGLGIPKFSQHKEAAWKFIEWASSADGAEVFFTEQAVAPPRLSLFEEYVDSGKIAGGDVVREQPKYVKPVAATGAPSWYPKFSKAAQDLINQVASGALSPADAAVHLDKQVQQIIAESK